MSLPRFSVEKPVSTLMFFIGVMIIGAISITLLPIELMPNIGYKKITIIARMRGGMPPSEVEELVTRPIEDAVSSVSHLQQITSRSEKEEAQIVLLFEPGTDMDFAALEVREKFARIKHKLPREMERPVIARYEESDSYVMIAAVTSSKYTTEHLRQLMDEDIKEYLLRVNGVANVDVYGGRERKILVELDQTKLAAYNLPILAVIDKLGVNNLNLLAGEVSGDPLKYLLRTIGEFKTVDQIRTIAIDKTEAGSVIRLGDIATVEDSFFKASAYARLGVAPVRVPKDIVSLYIHKESTANTIAVVKGINDQINGPIKKRLKKIGLVLGEDLKIDVVSDQAKFIMESITAVRSSLYNGAILSALMLLFLLRSWRSTFIIVVAIPISVIATFALIFFKNLATPNDLMSINVMTLAGLALGIGMLVDNSIVVLEHIFTKVEEGADKRAASIVAADEMFLAILASTLTTIVVFFPIVFVNEDVKMLYSGVAITITFSLLASLLVAITLVPAFSNLLLQRSEKGRAISGFYKMQRRLLKLAIRNRYAAVAASIGLLVLAAVVATRLDVEGFGQTEQGKFTINAKLDAGAKLDAADEMVKEVEAVLEKQPDIENFSSRTEGWSSRVYVSLVPLIRRHRSTEDIIEWLRPQFKEVERKYRGGFIYFSEIQAKEMPEVIIDAYGHNYEKLNELIAALGQGISSVPGIVDLKRSIEPGRPEYRFVVDKEKAGYYGLTTRDIADTVHAEMRGLRATLYHTESTEVETVARLVEDNRKDFGDLRSLTIMTPGGDRLELAQVCDFKSDLGPSEIHRKNKNRYIELSGTSTKLSLSKAIKLVKNALKDIKFPKDYYWEFGGNYERDMENMKQLILALLLSLVLLYMVLASLFQSYSQPFIIMLTIPLAFIGVIFVLWAVKLPIGTGVIIGIIMLGGIVVNNAIVLIDRINFLKKEGYGSFKAVLTGGTDRLRPIILTTVTTILGLIPMALNRSEASNLWAPLAITVMAGLTCSTILTLILIPSVYIIFEDMTVAARRQEAAKGIAEGIRRFVQLHMSKLARDSRR